MEAESVQTVVNELARKFAEDPSSVSLPEFLKPAVTGVLAQRTALLAEKQRPGTTYDPSPDTGLSALTGLQLLLSVLALARGLADQLERQIEADLEREPEAA
ncbi:MAG: hypothetical protein GY856_03470 [bacterium]|nr:hypothetical protein [bacterium]